MLFVLSLVDVAIGVHSGWCEVGRGGWVSGSRNPQEYGVRYIVGVQLAIDLYADNVIAIFVAVAEAV